MTPATWTCKHRPEPEMSYLMAYDDAQERMKRGEKQERCLVCGKCIWQSYYGPADWPTEAMNGGQCVMFGRTKAPRKGDA